MASSLLWAARKASLAIRAAAAAASRAARAADAAASRAARAADVAAFNAARAADVAADPARAARVSSLLIVDPICHTKRSSEPPIFSVNAADYDHLPEDSKIPTAKDLESDKAVWALYERWCVAFNKDRNYSEMIGRFEIFRYNAEDVYRWNTYVPADPKKAAIFRKKRKEVKLRLSKGLSVSHFDECYRYRILSPAADGGDPFLRRCPSDLLEELEKRHAPKDVTVDSA